MLCSLFSGSHPTPLWSRNVHFFVCQTVGRVTDVLKKLCVMGLVEGRWWGNPCLFLLILSLRITDHVHKQPAVCANVCLEIKYSCVFSVDHSYYIVAAK